MSNYEKDIKQLIEQMNRQNMRMQYPSNNQFSGVGNVISDQGTDQSPHIVNGQASVPLKPDQSPVNPINSVRPMGTPIGQKPQVNNLANIITSAPPSAAVEGGCPQCGMIHPPVPQGQKCPMAPVKVKDGNEEKIIDINKFLGNLKNIILSQAEKKGITDIEKLFKDIVVEVTRYLEQL